VRRVGDDNVVEHLFAVNLAEYDGTVRPHLEKC
jgi:hypothetical protein